MNDKNSNRTSFEMRSEKVRRLVGEMPRSLSLWALLISLIIILGLLCIVCVFPYPYSEGESILEHLLF